MNIGFIGVGVMGGPLARNLIRAGKTVYVYNRSPAGVEKTLAAGTTGIAATGMADMRHCKVVFSCLALPHHVEEKMLGPDGAYAHMPAGSVHVECSTIAPMTAATLAVAAAERGIAYVQCTLGKTPAHAEKAEEPLFIGGDAATIDRLQDIFALVGVPYRVGTAAASCAVKLISNMIGMSNLAILAEGLRLGEAAGLDKEALLPLLIDSGARSFQMDVRGPWIAKDDFAPRFGLDLALKDVRLGCEMAAGWGLDVRAMHTVLNYFKQASAAGHGAEDCNAVYKIIK